MNIINMLPSEIDRLRDAEPTRALSVELLEALKRLLSSKSKDNEIFFVAGKQLSRAGIDRIVSAEDIANLIENPSSTAVREFLEGLEPTFAVKITLAIIDRDQKSTPAAARRKPPVGSEQAVVDWIFQRYAMIKGFGGAAYTSDKQKKAREVRQARAAAQKVSRYYYRQKQLPSIEVILADDGAPSEVRSKDIRFHTSK